MEKQISIFDVDEKLFDIKIIDTLRNDPIQIRLKKAILYFYKNDHEKTKDNIDIMRSYLEKYKDVIRDYDKFIEIIDDLEKLID